MTSKSDARKKLDKDSFNPLGGDAPLDTSWGAIDNALYGGDADLNIPTTERRVAPSVKLDDIVPDFEQPRRLIPAFIRGDWRGEPHLAGELLSRWHVESEKALGRPINIEVMIDRATDGNEADAVMNPLAHNFLALVGLAGSIKRDGLENAVSVVGRTGRRKLVAGERRYWAYQLLRKWYGDKWDSIPAMAVDKPSVWRQAAENGAREELNAIAKARQLALLVMDMYAGDDGVSFNRIEFFNHEQEFYAQVADGNRYRIKSGMGERVLQVMGFRDPKYLYHIRNLLKIPRDLWDTADAENWTENRIRETLKPRETSTVVDVYTDGKKVNGVNTSTIVDISAPIGAFDAAMRGLLKEAVYRQYDVGLYCKAVDRHVFVSWSGDKSAYQIKQVGFNGGVSAMVQPNVTMLIETMQVFGASTGNWRVMGATDWLGITKPPVVKSFVPAPSPTPLSFDANEPRRAIMGDDDDIDDVMMGDSDDGDVPIIRNHPFGDGGVNMDAMDYRPSDLADEIPSDVRYVQSRTLLRHFLGTMVGYLETFGGDKADVIQFRDFTPEKLVAMKSYLSADEIAQMMTNWQDVVMEAMGQIQTGLTETLATIWKDVKGKQ